MVNAKNTTLNPESIIPNLGFRLYETRIIVESVALQEKNATAHLTDRGWGVRGR